MFAALQSQYEDDVEITDSPATDLLGYPHVQQKRKLLNIMQNRHSPTAHAAYHDLL